MQWWVVFNASLKIEDFGRLYVTTPLKKTPCRYLGFYIDSNLMFDKQVNDVISICNVKMRKIRRMGYLMNNNDAESFV